METMIVRGLVTVIFCGSILAIVVDELAWKYVIAAVASGIMTYGFWYRKLESDATERDRQRNEQRAILNREHAKEARSNGSLDGDSMDY